MALKHHPDKNKDNLSAAEKFKSKSPSVIVLYLLIASFVLFGQRSCNAVVVCFVSKSMRLSI